MHCTPDCSTSTVEATCIPIADLNMPLIKRIITYTQLHSQCKHVNTYFCQHTLRSRYITLPVDHTTHQYFSAKAQANNGNNKLQHHRNIGIIAHIDAGKTTTTERLLYYSGKISQLGNVDSGSTTTDYLPVERERGITVQSAAITIQWQNHTITLIDTPGHVDFTQEVEQAVRICDGIVCVVDSVKGVEAQTMTVWKQKQYYQIPSVVFINKMDRVGCDYDNAVQTVRTKLNTSVVELQMPLYTNNDSQQGEFIGVIDLIALQQYQWHTHSNKMDDGTKHDIIDITAEHTLYDDILTKREQMIDTLCECDDTLMELYMNSDSHLQLSVHDIQLAVRRCTVSCKLVPVLCGASLRNCAIQPLLNAVNNYLPSPLDIPYIQAKSLNTNKSNNDIVQRQCIEKQPLCALAFKVIHDTQRGNQPIVYVRVYSGILNIRDQLVNTWQTYLQRKSKQNDNKDNMVKERIQRIYAIDADHNTELQTVSCGQIVALIGLKHTYAGDTLCSVNDKQPIYLKGINTAQPVFSRSIEVRSITQQTELDTALKCLTAEDPSLRVTVDSDTGQTHISGMGELHIEIVYNKLVEQYKVDAELGPIRVAYKESISDSNTYELQYNGIIGNVQSDVYIELSVAPSQTGTGNAVIFDLTCDQHVIAEKKSLSLTDDLRDTIENTVHASLYRGPQLGYNCTDIQVTVDKIHLTATSTVAGINYATSKCLQYLLQNSTPIVLEPIMSCVVTVHNDSIGDILTDLTSRRRALIEDVVNNTVDNTTDIQCSVPLNCMIGYSTELRSRTSGNGTFTMEFQAYKPVDAVTLKQLLEKQ